ncbi:MAG: substrate-binding domain-containing protein [Desulfobulbaceae bacterium]|nr:substrate-binding domain-containing protein [Desulfobulbaceae bacterium]
MQTKYIKSIPSFFLILIFLLTGCEKTQQAEPGREILIYCGITMIRPMREIASIIEKQDNCTVKITKQGSGALCKSIKANSIGDLYLPGSESYINTAIKEKLIIDTVTVGYNRASLIVPKGNPLGITANLNNLHDPRYKVVLGSPESGSIGRETERILRRICIYEQAVANALYLTADSKGMVQALHDKKADLVFNWYATAKWDDNKNFMDALPLDHDTAPPHKLVLGLLRFSAFPDIARHFMELASSEQGQAIFDNYGFSVREQLP